jgi:hypothetical protein
MSAIAQRQNLPENLRLLAAMRQMYSRAKLLHKIYAGAGLVLEFIAPWVILWRPGAKVALDIIGAIAILLSLLLRRFVGDVVKRAATVQEQFDVQVFDLPWNRTLVGKTVTPELIHDADEAFKGNRDKLKNWYGDPGDLPRPLDVLVCQRSGLVWDRRLRQSYALLFNAVTIGYLIAGIVAGVITGQQLFAYIVALLTPSLPALVEGFKIVKEHREVADEEERVSGDILDLWERGLDEPTAATIDECRRLQDYNYIKRSRGPLVSDWWYWRFRDRDEATMRSTMAELRAKAERKRNAKGSG